MNSYPLNSWLSAHIPSVKSHLTHDYFCLCANIYTGCSRNIKEIISRFFLHRYWELVVTGGEGVWTRMTDDNDKGEGRKEKSYVVPYKTQIIET